MEECLRIFAYLEKKPKLTLYMDPQAPNLDYTLFQTDPDEFKEYYCDAEEQVPHMAPRPRGIPVITTAFIDSSNVESSLNKKHSAVAYNFTRWNVAAGVCKVAWVPCGENIADAMTKRLPESTRDYLFGNWAY